MKSFFLLVVALMSVVTGFAQRLLPSGPVPVVHTFNSKTTHKGTGTSSRLIAQGRSAGVNNRPKDSSIFTYSNGRGGDLNHPPQFDSRTNYYMWDTAQQAFINVQRELNTYNAMNLVDTQHSQQNIGGNFADAYRTTYYYDATGRDTAEKIENYSTSWVPVEYIRNTYDNNGHIISQTFLTWQFSQYVNSARTTWTYNTAGLLISQMGEQWINGTWVLGGESDYFTYDPLNRIVQYQQDYNSGGFVNSIVVTYEYLSTDTTYTSAVTSHVANGTYTKDDSAVVSSKDLFGNILTIVHYYFTSGGMPTYRETFTYTPSNLTASHLFEYNMNGTWDTSTRVLYSYNSYDQLTRVYSRVPGNNANTWVSSMHDSDFRYYYEEYQSNLSVRSHSSANNSLKLWPAPAQSILMLQFKPLQPGAYVIELLDITGKKVMSRSGRAGGVEEQSLDVSPYAPGVYLLRISCGGEVMTRSFSVQH